MTEALVPAGAPIAVIAPCGAYNEARFEAGLAIAAAHGHDLRPLPGLLAPHRYLAGSDTLRREQLIEALTHPDYAAVWIARGGYGLTRILDGLDVSGFPSRPVIGFSDVTALFNVLHQAGKGPCVHGPVVHSLSNTDPESVQALFDTLAGAPSTWSGERWNDGDCQAPIVGGNLCLLAATAGTSQQLDARGQILLIEEVGEPTYRVDRMLQQVRSAGILDGVVGVALGQFVDCRTPDGADYTLNDMLAEHLLPLNVPVIANLPVGHGAKNQAFVLGDTATISKDQLFLERASPGWS